MSRMGGRGERAGPAASGTTSRCALSRPANSLYALSRMSAAGTVIVIAPAPSARYSALARARSCASSDISTSGEAPDLPASCATTLDLSRAIGLEPFGPPMRMSDVRMTPGAASTGSSNRSASTPDPRSSEGGPTRAGAASSSAAARAWPPRPANSFPDRSRNAPRPTSMRSWPAAAAATASGAAAAACGVLVRLTAMRCHAPVLFASAGNTGAEAFSWMATGVDVADDRIVILDGSTDAGSTYSSKSNSIVDLATLIRGSAARSSSGTVVSGETATAASEAPMGLPDRSANAPAAT